MLVQQTRTFICEAACLSCVRSAVSVAPCAVPVLLFRISFGLINTTYNGILLMLTAPFSRKYRVLRKYLSQRRRVGVECAVITQSPSAALAGAQICVVICFVASHRREA